MSDTTPSDELREAFEKYCHENFDIYSKFECWQEAIAYEKRKPQLSEEQAKGAIEEALKCYSVPCSDDSGDIIIHVGQTVDEIYRALLATHHSASTITRLEKQYEDSVDKIVEHVCEIARLEQEIQGLREEKPCPYVYTSKGSTSHCMLAASDTTLINNLQEQVRGFKEALEFAKGRFVMIEVMASAQKTNTIIKECMSGHESNQNFAYQGYRAAENALSAPTTSDTKGE